MFRKIVVPKLIVVDFESPYYTTLDTPSRPAMHLFREEKKKKTKIDLGRVNPGRGSSSCNYL